MKIEYFKANAAIYEEYDVTISTDDYTTIHVNFTSDGPKFYNFKTEVTEEEMYKELRKGKYKKDANVLYFFEKDLICSHIDNKLNMVINNSSSFKEELENLYVNIKDNLRNKILIDYLIN